VEDDPPVEDEPPVPVVPPVEDEPPLPVDPPVEEEPPVPPPELGAAHANEKSAARELVARISLDRDMGAPGG
jgi:hypothetical protein